MEIRNDLTYTVKLKRIEVIKLCLILDSLGFSDEFDEDTRKTFKNIRDKLHEQYVAEDEKRSGKEE